MPAEQPTASCLTFLLMLLASSKLLLERVPQSEGKGCATMRRSDCRRWHSLASRASPASDMGTGHHYLPQKR